MHSNRMPQYAIDGATRRKGRVHSLDGLDPARTALVVIDMQFEHTAEPWTDGIGGDPEYGIPWSPDGQHLAILTATDGVVVADVVRNANVLDPNKNGNGYQGELHRLGPVADCWIDWSPDGTALYGGSPDGCQSVVVIPLSNPSTAFELPGSNGGVASWQPGSVTGP